MKKTIQVISNGRKIIVFDTQNTKKIFQNKICSQGSWNFPWLDSDRSRASRNFPYLESDSTTRRSILYTNS